MRLFLKSKRSDYNAICEYNDGIFTVLKGAKLSPYNSKFVLSKQVSNIRNDKSIVGNDLVTKKDVSFTSSSTSAQFVVAQSVNGNRAWKKENGESFKKNKK